MTVADLIEMLSAHPYKEAIVLVSIENGFAEACITDSGPAKDDDGNIVFVILPCTCHDEPMEFDVRAEDFDLSEN